MRRDQRVCLGPLQTEQVLTIGAATVFDMDAATPPIKKFVAQSALPVDDMINSVFDEWRVNNGMQARLDAVGDGSRSRQQRRVTEILDRSGNGIGWGNRSVPEASVSRLSCELRSSPKHPPLP